MKFEEKLIELRKQKFLSQEELAGNLDVTRQTISKWELGQSKPDMDKLIEISRFFEVEIDSLTNDSLGIVKKEEKKNKPKKERKFLLYIFVVILIALIVTLAIRIGIEKEKNQDKSSGIFSIFTNIFNRQNQSLNDFNDFSSGIKDMYENETEKMNEDYEQKVQQMNDDSNKRTHNMDFESFAGTNKTVFVKNVLDKIISNNKKDKEHIVTLVYKNEEITDETRIKEIKKSLEEWGEYEISIDYDESGYVNKITLEDM